MLIRVVLYSDPRLAWCAHGLECDVMVSAATADAALDGLLKIVQAHAARDTRERRTPLADFAPAPKSAWDTFSAAAARNAPIVLRRNEPSGSLQLLIATAAAVTG